MAQTQPVSTPSLQGAMGALQASHRACTRCVQAGLLPAACPIFSGRAGQRMLLVGQAPGPSEAGLGRPFAGRAGRQLFRWLVRAGFRDEADARERIYITSVTTCFPGRRPDGGGDRRPSAAEVGLCAPWLADTIELLRPRLVLLVGSLALSRFLPGLDLDAAVGTVFAPAGGPIRRPSGAEPRLLLPLPHPSGQSRWLNHPGRARQLEEALRRLARLARWAEADADPVL